MTATRNIGRNIARLREIKGINQKELAERLGVTQQAVSRIELSDSIEEETLQRIAGVLGLATESIRNFNEEAIFNILNNVFNDHSSAVKYHVGGEEKIKELYEDLLRAEREKVAILEKYIAKFEK